MVKYSRFFLLSIIYLFFSSGLFAVDAELSFEFGERALPRAQMPGELNITNPKATLIGLDYPPDQGYVIELKRRNVSRSTRIVNGKRSESYSIGLTIQFFKSGNYTLENLEATFNDGSSVTIKPLVFTVQGGRSDLIGNCVVEQKYVPEKIVPGQECEYSVTVWLRRDQRRLTISSLDAWLLPKEAITLEKRQQLDPVYDFGEENSQWIGYRFRQNFTLSTPGTYGRAGQQSYGRTKRDMFTERVEIIGTIPVAPTTLIVSELPEQGKPTHFNGLIGESSISSQLDRERISLGEGCVLSVSIKGNRVSGANKPRIPEITNIQVYEKDETISEDGSEITFRYDLVPSAEGIHSIPSFELAYFDPETNRYRNVQSGEVSLQVIPGRKQQLSIVGASQQEIESEEEKPSISLPGLQNRNTNPASRGIDLLLTLLSILGGSFFLGAGLSALALRQPKDGFGPQLLKALQTNDLGQANTLLQQKQHLTLSAETTLALNDLLKNVEHTRYGSPNVSPTELRTQAEKLITLLAADKGGR